MAGIYDPLDVLNRAEQGADNWWSNTLQNAKQRVQLDQMEFDNAFANDKKFNTYASDLFKTNAENVYGGVKAQTNTDLEPYRYDFAKTGYEAGTGKNMVDSGNYDRMLTPENTVARHALIDDSIQSKYANLRAGAETAGIYDPTVRASMSQGIARQMPGALSAQGAYGAAQSGLELGSVGNDIATGNFEKANEWLGRQGAGFRFEPGPTAGTVVQVDANGNRSMPINTSAAAKFFNDRFGAREGQAQQYVASQYDKLHKNNYEYKAWEAESKALHKSRDAAMKDGNKEEVARLNTVIRRHDEARMGSQRPVAPVYSPTSQQSQGADYRRHEDMIGVD